jgi:hypothetical protein
MARVHLLTVHPASDFRVQGAYLALKENARLDRFKVHQLTDDPESADMILFVEVDTGRLCEDVLRHPYIRRYREKCFMFSSDWRVIPFLPGIYTSIEKSWYLPGRSRPGFYLSCLMNPLVRFEPTAGREFLYSFMGDIQTHPVRKILAGLQHPPGAFVDTSSDSQAVMWQGSPEQKNAFWTRYVDLAKRSRFILCPRGVAPSSIRLFEAMCLGRVPVILSDEWLPPAGPDWDRFSLRIPESEAAHVPQILVEKESAADEMGLIARSEWEKHFSPDIIFHRVVELCFEIRQSRRLPEALSRLTILPQLLRPRNLRELFRQLRQRAN